MTPHTILSKIFGSRKKSGGGKLDPLMSPAPHIHSPEKTAHMMLDVIIALTPCFIYGIYLFGARAFVVTLVSVACCVLFESVFAVAAGRKPYPPDLSAVVSGLILAALMPASVPLYFPVLGALFASVAFKGVFGGLGKNPVNPALAARMLLELLFPARMFLYTDPGAKLPLFSSHIPESAISCSIPLAEAVSGSVPTRSLFDIFIGNIPGTIGGTSALLIIAACAFLAAKKTFSANIPIAAVTSFMLFGLVFGSGAGQSSSVMTVYELISGGFLFCIVFCATDPVTSPQGVYGKIIYGAGIGLLTLVIRRYSENLEGVGYAILIMNLLSYSLDSISRPRYFGEKHPRKGNMLRARRPSSSPTSEPIEQGKEIEPK